MGARSVIGELTTLVTGGESTILESKVRNPVVGEPMLELHGVAAVADTVALGEVRARCG